MKILSIETSCDETAIAILKCSGGLRKPSFEILANEVSSQIKIHRPFGGVVPNLAKREHIKNLPKIWERIKNNELRIKNKNPKSAIHNSKFIIPDLIAVTVGPGLEPALWTGINFAQELSKKLKKPLIGVNHMEGHLFGFLLKTEISNSVIPAKAGIQKKDWIPCQARNDKIQFPAIGLVVSGGHTILLKMQSLTKWEKLGETVDDAAGEAFDKVARILGLQYPGGPEIEKLAKQGNPKAITFPRPMLNQKNYNFSFSGLKTSVLYYFRDNVLNNLTSKEINDLRGPRLRGPKIPGFNIRVLGDGGNEVLGGQKIDSLKIKQLKADIAASFQQAAIDVLTKKTMRAAEEFSTRSIILCGGVACNKTLRETMKSESEKRGLSFIAPEMKFNTDNAAMIGVAAYINLFAKKSFGRFDGLTASKLKTRKSLPIEADSNLNL